jgi:hypothetical protein
MIGVCAPLGKGHAALHGAGREIDVQMIEVSQGEPALVQLHGDAADGGTMGIVCKMTFGREGIPVYIGDTVLVNADVLNGLHGFLLYENKKSMLFALTKDLEINELWKNGRFYTIWKI